MYCQSLGIVLGAALTPTFRYASVSRNDIRSTIVLWPIIAPKYCYYTFYLAPLIPTRKDNLKTTIYLFLITTNICIMCQPFIHGLI